MAAIESQAHAAFEMVLKACYWFHDLSFASDSNGAPKLNREMSLGLLILVTMMIIIIVQCVFPNVLRSLVDCIIEIIKAVRPQHPQANNTNTSASAAKAFEPLYKNAGTR